MKNNEFTIDSLNRDYWYVVKGIGALSIVLGHTCYFAVKYVYMYHLVIFFFAGGYLYSEKKYGDRPWANVAARLSGLWYRYVFFVFVFILCHNLFLDLGIIINENYYDLRTYAITLGNTIVFESSGGQMGGALWFVPVLIVASGMLGMTVWEGRRISGIFHDNKVAKYVFIIVQGLVLGAFGVMLNLRGISLSYHIHTAFLIIPIMIAGYLVRTFCGDLKKILKIYVAVPFFLFFLFSVNVLNWRVELAKEQIIGPWQFFVISFIGIYLCLYLAYSFMNIYMLRSYFVLIGQYSFEIMAGHFLTTKIVDILYAKMIGQNDRQVFGRFVCAYSRQCWLFYAVAGTLFIASIFWLKDRIRGSLKKSYL